MVRNKAKYYKKYNFTEDINDILFDNSDLVIDLMNNVDTSLEYFTKIVQHNKPIVVTNKVFLSEHGNKIFDLSKENRTKVLIGSCISTDMPILVSRLNPYFSGSDRLEKRGRSSSDIASAILEDIFYFYS